MARTPTRRLAVKDRAEVLRRRFGDLVRLQRDGLKESQEVFAERFGWTQKKVSLVESGRVSLTLDLIEHVAHGLDTDPYALLGHPDLPLFKPPSSPEEWRALAPAMTRATIGTMLSAQTVEFSQRTSRPDAKAIVSALVRYSDDDVRMFRRLVEGYSADSVRGAERQTTRRRGTGAPRVKGGPRS